MITTTCPNCNARYQLDAALAGKTVRCKPCQQTFVVFEVIDALDVAPPTSTGIVPADSVRSAAPPAAAPAPIPPPRRAERVAASQAPRPRAARTTPGGSGVAWVIGGAVAFFLFAVLCVFAFVRMDQTPVQAPIAKKIGDKKGADPGFRHNPGHNEKKVDEKKADDREPMPPVPMPPVVVPPAVIAAPPFQNGQLQIEAQLTRADPVDPYRHAPSKTYEVELSANRTYTIEMTSMDFEAVLRIHNPFGANVASGAAAKDTGNARIRFSADSSGKHRVVAVAAGGRVGRFSLTIREESQPKPPEVVKAPEIVKAPDVVKAPDPSPPLPKGIATGVSCVRSVRQETGGIAVTTLATPGVAVGDIVWTPTGDAFFLLTEKGLLCRVAAEGFIEQRRLPIDKKATCLALSAEGLVVTLPDREELWLVDPTSLDVKNRIRVPGVIRGLSGPNLKFAVATNAATARASGSGRVAMVDLASGAISDWNEQIPTPAARIAPDGTRYFAVGTGNILAAHEIRGKSLVFRGYAVPNGRPVFNYLDKQSIAVSPDGSYLCLAPLPVGDGGAYRSQIPIYAAQRLHVPAFTLVSSEPIGGVAFDSVGQFVLAHGPSKHLVVHSMTGAMLAEYSFGPDVGATRQFAVHPEGNKLLVSSDTGLWYVELDGLKSKVPPPTNPNPSVAEKKVDIVRKAPAFENGELKIDGVLSTTDPKDAVRPGPCNVFTVELSAGRTYVIDLKSKDFDAYLRLENPGGVTVASDDDGGDGLNSRIRYTPQQTGAYRVCATVLGSGTGRYTLTIRDTSIPGAKAP